MVSTIKTKIMPKLSKATSVKITEVGIITHEYANCPSTTLTHFTHPLLVGALGHLFLVQFVVEIVQGIPLQVNNKSVNSIHLQLYMNIIIFCNEFISHTFSIGHESLFRI